jgi:hypothetical protein
MRQPVAHTVETLIAVGPAGEPRAVVQLLFAFSASLLSLPRAALARVVSYLPLLNLDEPDVACWPEPVFDVGGCQW